MPRDSPGLSGFLFGSLERTDTETVKIPRLWERESPSQARLETDFSNLSGTSLWPLSQKYTTTTNTDVPKKNSRLCLARSPV